MDNEKKTMQIAIRIRPLNPREIRQNFQSTIKILDQHTLIFDPNLNNEKGETFDMKRRRTRKALCYRFDGIYDSHSRNEEIFEISVKPLVNSILNGYNCSVFAYGATGAGKTHTMAANENGPGITCLLMKELFNNIDEMRSENTFELYMSALEVYNEQVFNLLNRSDPLKLRECLNTIVIGGLEMTKIDTVEELLELLSLSNRNRTQHPTDANAESSRSHAIFQVHIKMMHNESGLRKHVKLSMIDLAGSERAASSKCTGQRFKEGANINKSLLALGNCICKLADGNTHIPYRDSNLTRILKDSLGGNCQTLMIANISPSYMAYEDTYNTLKYAFRARTIQSNMKQNIIELDVSRECLLQKIQDQYSINENLTSQITYLEKKIIELEKKNGDIEYTDLINSNITIPVDDSKFEQFYLKANEIFSVMNRAQKQYFNIQSSEKVLKILTKMQEQNDICRKQLGLEKMKYHMGDDVDDSNDLVWLMNKRINILRYLQTTQPSYEEMSKEISQKYDADLAKWARRYKCANGRLKQLKQEIDATGFNAKLITFIKTKEMQHQILKTRNKTDHIIKINSIYGEEHKKLNDKIILSNEILSRIIKLLDVNGIPTENELQEKIHDLHSMIENNVSFNKVFEEQSLKQD